MKRVLLACGLLLLVPIGVWFVRAVEAAREAARRSECVCHLKWAVVALHNYHSESGSFPVGTLPNPALPPERRLGWPVVCFAWLTGSGVSLQVDRSRAWDDPVNWPPKIVADGNITFVGMTPADTFSWTSCPDDPASLTKTRPLPLTYVGIAGLGSDAPTLPAGHVRAGVFGYDRVTRLSEITDGTSQTLILAETRRDPGPWMAGGSTSVRGVDPGTRPYFGPNRPFGGYHPGGANVALADGSVRFLRGTIHPKVFESLSTIAGGEPIPSRW